MSILYIEKIPEAIRDAFARKVESICAGLGIHPDWLMQVMWAESRLKATAANRQGKDKHLVAAGLLQFTKGSGIITSGKVPSLAHILNMSALQQLDLVAWYFAPYKGKMRSYYDVYAVTFFPAMIGKPDHWVLQSKKLPAATIAAQNKVISKGRSRITVADFKRYVYSQVPENLRQRILNLAQETADAIGHKAAVVKEAISSHPKESVGIGTGVIVGICLLGWVIIRKG